MEKPEAKQIKIGYYTAKWDGIWLCIQNEYSEGITLDKQEAMQLRDFLNSIHLLTSKTEKRS